MLATYETDIDRTLINKINDYKLRLKNIKERPFFINPKSMYEDALKEVKNLSERLDLSMNHLLKMKQEKLNAYGPRLKALSVDATLNRGFAIMMDENNHIVKAIEDVEVNTSVKTKLSNGVITSVITKKEKDDGK